MSKGPWRGHRSLISRFKLKLRKALEAEGFVSAYQTHKHIPPYYYEVRMTLNYKDKVFRLKTETHYYIMKNLKREQEQVDLIVGSMKEKRKQVS